MIENSELEFVDTCILLYAYDKSDKNKNSQAVSLIAGLWKSGRGALSIQVLQELYVNVTKKVPNPLTASEAAHIVFDLGQWKLHRPDLENVLEAIDIHQRNQISFWDAMIVCSAKNLGCKTIWTEDLNQNQHFEGIKVQNPFSPK
ncbi:MAG: PIN domain-containing protein [Bacillota bacterium]|nr:PIN domain-containing protein [Bacillota bacterium]